MLELGCGDASLWTENMDLLPSDVTVVLSDISDGMVRDVKKSIGTEDQRFQYEVMDAHHINATDHSSPTMCFFTVKIFQRSVRKWPGC